MKARIDVDNKEEKVLIERGLQDDEVRALVKVAGALSALTPRARIRAMEFVKDYFAERDGHEHEHEHEHEQ